MQLEPLVISDPYVFGCFQKAILARSAVALGTLLASCSVDNRPLAAPSNSTYHEIRLIYVEIQLAESAKGRPISEIIQVDPYKADDLNGAVANLVGTNLGPGTVRNVKGKRRVI